MRVLIVCSGNVKNFNFILHHAFVYEQIEAIKRTYDVEYDTFFVKGKGVLGYLKNLNKLKIKIKEYSPDFVHAHFGLSGLLACLQRINPVVITFHGSDINITKNKYLSRLAVVFSKHDIFISNELHKKILGSKKYSIIPCGIDFEAFYPIDKLVAREKLDLLKDKIYILFASDFNNSIKNASLAFSTIAKLNIDVELLELKNKSREEVNLLLNACDLLLLTSISEGSPQVIKEAMACNCPIVATDVGDIREVIDSTKGCYITSSTPDDVADKIKIALEFDRRTDGRDKINHFDNKLIAMKIYKVYQSVTGTNI